MKILHIDDNSSITAVFSKILKLKNHDYHICSDGKSGLEQIKNEDFDVIFLDLTMPSFSGYDVLEALKKDEKSTSNIVILTATNLSSDEKSELESFQIHKLLQKPVTMAQILDCINSIKNNSVTVTP